MVIPHMSLNNMYVVGVLFSCSVPGEEMSCPCCESSDGPVKRHFRGLSFGLLLYSFRILDDYRQFV